MNKIPYFDGHCDTILRTYETGASFMSSGGHLDLWELDPFSRYAQIFTFFYSADKMKGRSMLPIAKKMHELFLHQTEICGDRLLHCRSAAEAERNSGEGRCCAFLSIEGADLLDCDPDNLEMAASWGVRLINPTWNCANRLSGSHCQDSARGLSDMGKAFVREANALGIMMDVSHLSERGFWDLAEKSTLPIVASHSNSRTVYMHSRGLSDDQFRAIAQSGGVVGLNYYTEFISETPTMDWFLRHLEHFLDLGGEKTVALGSDFDGCEAMLQGIERLPDVWKIYDALEQRGYGSQLLEDIFWNNWMRIM